MLVRMKLTEEESWETVGINSITLRIGSTLSGVIKVPPNDRASEFLKLGVPVDVEFSRESDDDGDVVVVSGLVAGVCEIGADSINESPIIDSYEYGAAGYEIID
jgi:hypothetical protein